MTEIDQTGPAKECFVGGKAVRHCHAVFKIPLDHDDRLCKSTCLQVDMEDVASRTESLRSVGAGLASTWCLRNLRDQRTLPFRRMYRTTSASLERACSARLVIGATPHACRKVSSRKD